MVFLLNNMLTELKDLKLQRCDYPSADGSIGCEPALQVVHKVLNQF
jgi:hypothetical protein